MPSPRIPKYRLHRATGRAVVTINGRDLYLGKHGSSESHREYQRILAEFLAAGGVLRPDRGAVITVAQLVEQYMAHVRVYYVKNGRPTTQQEHVRRSLKPVLELYGDQPACEFGPIRLKAVRQRMIEYGWNRRHINRYVSCIRRAFSWAVSEELIDPSIIHGLKSVEGLRAGRSAAKESQPVRPAAEADVRATQAVAHRILRDMIELQLLTGMRPGELCALRPADLDRGGRVKMHGGSMDAGSGVWVYQPADHKMSHLQERIIILGPRAQAVLAPYLFREPLAFCFSPAESIAEFRERQRQARKTKVQPSQADRSKPNPKKKPRVRYDTNSYRQAIQRYCDLAGVPRWHPHQLRHSAATRLVDEFGWEVARVVLGQRTLDATRIYAEDPLKKAAAAMAVAG